MCSLQGKYTVPAAADIRLPVVGRASQTSLSASVGHYRTTLPLQVPGDRLFAVIKQITADFTSKSLVAPVSTFEPPSLNTLAYSETGSGAMRASISGLV